MRKIILVNSLLILLIIISAEIFIRYFPSEHGQEFVYSDCLTQGNTLYGFKGPLNRTCSYHKKTNKNRSVFNVSYNMNEYGFREVTPSNISPSNSSSDSILTLGCSYTFGLGVEDSERYPSRLQHYLPNTEVLDFSMPGYSINNLLAYFQTGEDLPRTKNHNVTTIIYYALFDHIRRVVSKQAFPLYSPLYEIDGDQIVYSGVTTSQGYKKDFLYSSYLLSSLFPELYAPPLTEKDYDLYYYLFAHLVRLLKEHYPKAEFIMVYQGEFPRNLMARIENLPIRIISFKRFTPENCQSDFSKCTIPYDGHPLPSYYDEMAKFLAREIKFYRSERVKE